MKILNVIKDFIRDALYRSGVLSIWHRYRNQQALTVLMFHRVLPVDSDAMKKSEREFVLSLPAFGNILDFVIHHYNVVGLDQVKAAVDGRGRLPDCPLLITFDDGWRDTVKYAMPELKKRDLPALLFLTTEVIELDQDRWWQDAVVAVLANPKAAFKLLMILGMSANALTQSGGSQRVAAKLAGMLEVDRRRLLQQVDPQVLDQIKDRQMVNLTDLNRWRENGFQIGGHGHTHSPIAYARDLGEEVSMCRNRMRAMGVDVLSLSYPHGVKSEESRTALMDAGFHLVFDSNPCLVKASNLQRMRFDLPRIHLPENSWTTKNGRIDPARLAFYLFPRPMI